ncbi:hypothetical protein IGI04_033858 [Brassica rapa subsp. trilocularis]|uniref:DUF4005 domain-containing protein n=1 Tax=Brassica rapa subsp. trilocularis TaxID=1813537 RepID=A0ABQ7L738_BRACM|nr:hypothetical protein IGI04_033858 [Brassica rapa subsp. trilocularis]
MQFTKRTKPRNKLQQKPTKPDGPKFVTQLGPNQRPTLRNPRHTRERSAAASQIRLFVARTRVNILDVEGHVSRDQHDTPASRPHRRSDLRINRPHRDSADPNLFTVKSLWDSNAGENQSPWRDLIHPRSPQPPKASHATSLFPSEIFLSSDVTRKKNSKTATRRRN